MVGGDGKSLPFSKPSELKRSNMGKSVDFMALPLRLSPVHLHAAIPIDYSSLDEPLEDMNLTSTSQVIVTSPLC
jgi:hypothetical protein